jgi:hypothetical protein
MIAHHISVFAENKPGRLDHITEILAGAGVNIRAIKISDSGDFGVVKMLVDDPDAAFQALTAHGVTASKKEIVAVVAKDRPGGLHDVLRILTAHAVNVDDAYGFVVRDGAVLVIEVGNVREANVLLEQSGLHLLSKEEIYAL